MSLDQPGQITLREDSRLIESVPAVQLVACDVIDSHDGHEHIVTHAEQIGLTVLVCVERSDGTSYATDLDPDALVRVVLS